VDLSHVEIELQFTPTKTSTPEMRAVVERAFADAQLCVANWTVPWGEHHDPAKSGMQWAQPSLDVCFVSPPLDDCSRTGALTAAFGPNLGIALAAIRDALPELPLGIVECRQNPRRALATGPRLDGPATRRALDRVPLDGLGTGTTWIWDEDADAWCELVTFTRKARRPGAPYEIGTARKLPSD
jgi:hypothetical protein